MNQYLEMRNDAYYIAGTRIGLDVIVHEFRNGTSTEAIFDAYPAICSLAKLYGAITFILEHPDEVNAYLQRQEERFREFAATHPLPAEMIARQVRAREQMSATTK